MRLIAPALVGTRFGRLLVVEYVGQLKRQARLKCRCDCGREKVARMQELKMGKTTSCGCRDLEWKQEFGRRRVTHDGSNRPEHKSWLHMMGRCYNPTDAAFAAYGGRGITVSPEWRADFAAFYRDMGDRPTKYHSIDRIDNNGPYAHGNCKWSTKREQNNNRRDNRRLTYAGMTNTLAEWSRITGIQHGTLIRRASVGWSTEDVLTHPVGWAR